MVRVRHVGTIERSHGGEGIVQPLGSSGIASPQLVEESHQVMGL